MDPTSHLPIPPALALLLAAALAPGCASRAACDDDAFYTFEQSPGEISGSYRGFPFATLDSVSLTADAEGDQGTLELSGTGGDLGDDDDSASGGDDDDSAGGGAREYEDLAALQTWAITAPFVDERAGNRSTDGAYTFMPDEGDDCTTFGDKCFNFTIAFNGRDEAETYNYGRLEILPLDEGTRGCMYMQEADGDPESTIRLYWND